MSKLFSRTKSAHVGASSNGNGAMSDTDDFGRVKSIPFKRGKTESALHRTRQRTLSNPNLLNAATLGSSRNNVESYYDRPETPKDLPILPDGLFLTTNLSLQGPTADDLQHYLHGHLAEDPKHEYGYLATDSHVVLGLDEVVRLVDVVADELGHRGLTTPLLFSPLAIDIRPNVVKKLISSFIATCPHHLALSTTEAKWREEATFAGPHELAMLLRWGLARIIRLEKGVEVRGFITWDSYVLWRQEEHANGYQLSYLAHFFQALDSPVRTLFLSLFHLLTRLTANATSSGLTPVQLATCFGPLIFGLGNPSFPFSHTYACYLRASHATEHLLLAFIRWQDSQTQLKGSMPVRLKDWVRGYPSMVPDMGRIEKPRRGAKLTRLSSIRRNVRLYSPDLVKNSASWSVPQGEFQNSKDWSRIAPPFLKLTPRFSDTFRKYLNVPPTFHPDMGPGSNVAEGARTPDEEGRSELGLFDSSLLEDERFRSLTDMRWGTFENFGFSDTDKNKLAFDLTESARKARSEKRETLSWNDFSSAGFSRTDEPLSATLQFSTPVSSSIHSWASQSAEIHRKLKKAQKALPPFGWDTTPVVGREEMIEEGFLEVFCSLVYGSGWMDRAETTFRECNWALVEFKALPTQRPPEPPSGDPRTSSTLFLFEEFVPREYRDQLAAPKKKGLFAPTALFVASLNSRDKKWKPAATLNGKPYVVGNTPTGTPAVEVVGTKNRREADFEHMLKSSHATTKVSLTRGVSSRDHPVPTPLTSSMPLPTEDVPPVPPLPATSPIKGKGRFKIKRKKSGGIQPAEYDEMDFETREASESSDEDLLSPGSNNTRDKRMSRDDAWIDILVADNKKRVPGQDAELGGGSRRKAGNRSDPDLARQEMARALEGIPPPMDDDGFPFNTQVHGQSHLDAHGHLGYGNPHDQIHIEESLPEPEPYPYSPPLRGISGRRSMESDEYTHSEGPMIRVQSPSTIASRNEQRWIGAGGHYRESTDEGDFEPIPNTLSQEVEIPSFIDTEKDYSQERIPPQPTSATLPPSPLPPTKASLPADQVTPDGSPNRPKVSALIDMYQQKAAPGPSKLPVRTASLDNPKSAADKSPPVPVPEPIPEPEVVAAPLDLPAGRVSPGRYVHGAPLHNVMEEEEED